MNTQSTVGQYLVDRLQQLGLEHLFSIAGDYCIDWLNNYVEPSHIQVIEEVNELNAGYAADGYARLKGIGALCVTYSAGALCATNPLAGAYVEKVPIVMINGAPSIKRTLTFEQTGFSAHHFISGRETDLQVFEYITAASVRVDNPDLAPMLIDYALTQCITERRPVYIELLEDIVDQSCNPAPKEKLVPAKVMSDPQSRAESVKALSGELSKASKPLIWLGVEVDRFGLQRQANCLIQRLRIPYVTELLSKAVLSEDDEFFAGVFDGQASSQAVQQLVKGADFILSLGVWLTDINSLGWTFDFEKTAFVSLDTVKLGAKFWAQVALEHFMEDLLAAGIKPTDQAPPQKPTYEPPCVDASDPITYQGFYDFIPRFIDDNAIIGSDASLNYFGSILLKVGSQRGFISQSSYSSIGYIGPAATGICLACRAMKTGRRVMVFSGDGGFQMTPQCLSTQARFGLNPIIFVIDNGVYGVEQWLADATVFKDPGRPFYKSCELRRWDYSKLAAVFDCAGRKVETYGDLEVAMKEAGNNRDKPTIIQVVLKDIKSIPNNAVWKEAADAQNMPIRVAR